jgi:dUTP pyrophosphatase
MSLPVEILKIHPDAEIPEYKTAGACAFDLAPVEDATIAPGEIVRLRTGLVVRVPDGYVLLVAARSSLAKKHGLCVPQGVGIVDNDYCGPADELLLQLLNFTAAPVEVKKGERIAQGIFVPFARAAFSTVDAMSNPSRGGYGSTG